MSDKIICPIHRIGDCSPLLNGCSRVIKAYAERESGCCPSCEGTGRSGDPATSGACWDCRGTGHPHDSDQSC